MWSALKEVARNSTLYYKQFNLFVGLILLVVVVIGGVKFFIPSSPEASVDLPRALQPTEEAETKEYAIQVTKEGGVTVNDVSLRNPFTFEANVARFLLVLVRESPIYVNELRATVSLPTAVTNGESLTPRIYAIHGVGEAFYRINDNRTITFTALGIPEGGTVSIEMAFPRDYFAFSSLGRIRATLSTLPVQTWTTIGITLPGLTLLFLAYLLVRRWFGAVAVATKKVIDTPPTNSPPAVVGALYRGKIGNQEIAATILDLAQRGFITIHHDRHDAIVFGKGSSLFNAQATSLRPFEIFLLHQIFGNGSWMAKTQDIEADLNHELFSSKVAMSLVNMYDAVQAEGYFINSPNRYYLRYKLIGMILFFIGLAGLLYGSVTLPEPAYILFAWVGMMTASLLIIAIAPGLPTRSRRGTATLKQWIAFRHHLTRKEPIATTNTDEFFDYLPYALVMHCERDWLARWHNQAVMLPDWYSAEEETPYRAEDYEASLIHIMQNITIYVGIETEKNERGVTLYNRDATAVGEASWAIAQAFSASPAFDGVAIHTLNGYQDMKSD